MQKIRKIKTFLKLSYILLALVFFITPVLVYATQTPEPLAYKSLKTENKEPVKPYFWKIEKDGKSSYILGTLHEGVRFDDLPYHEDIKSILRSIDFLLTEIPYPYSYYFQFTKLMENSLINEQKQKIKEDIKNKKGSMSELLNLLNKNEKRLLIKLLAKNYFTELLKYYLVELILFPTKDVLKNIVLFHPFFIQKAIRSLDPNPHKAVNIKKDHFIEVTIPDGLDKDIVNYFLRNNISYKNLFLKYVTQLNNSDALDLDLSYDTMMPGYQYFKDFKPISSLDDLETRFWVERAELTLIGMKDIKKWLENYSWRLSKNIIKENSEAMNKLYEKSKELYSSTEFETGITVKMRLLDTEVRQEKELTWKWALDFRNQIWLKKIIKAFETYNSIFIAGGVEHFVQKERYHYNIPELQEYLEQNKDLPTNILDMLKKEGFKVTRFGEGDFLPSQPCQKAFKK